MHQLTLESVRTGFPEIDWHPDLFSEEYDWKQMLLSASYLAQDSSEKAQATALRIAHHCLISSADDNYQKSAAALIFDILTNYPSINLAINKKYIDEKFMEKIPFPLRLDSMKRKINYSVYQNEKPLLLNRFQKKVFDELEDFDCLSVSAPTSAGKSFVIEQFVKSYVFQNGPKNIVFIVPTRALIQQVEIDMQVLFRDFENKPIVTSIPQISPKWKEQVNVFVFTQERLQLLINDAPNGFFIDLLIVDEAQKIGDGARGILLQRAIETVASQERDSKIIFLSPMSENPDSLFQHVKKNGKAIVSEMVTVNQNLIWASQNKKKSRVWDVELCLHNTKSVLGTVSLKSAPETSERLALVALAMAGDMDGNLIYANGQADAENVARLMAENVPAIKVTKDMKNLIRLVKKSVHPQYNLCKTLEFGVAFHYGNMPLLVRTEIEKLFKEGEIKFLVCTSTLIEGVNLPAKSIFVRRPTKGKRRPMGEIDFWNMAGRAGRLGKEFQGNIVCIDPTDWDELPPTHRKKYKITKALSDIASNVDDLISYINTGKITKEGPDKQELEHSFSYFYLQFSRYGSVLSTPYSNVLPKETLERIDECLVNLKSKISIPLYLMERNPGVNPISQQELLMYFREYKKPVTELIPVLPGSENSYENYIRFLNRISKYLSGDHPALNPYYAILVQNWMQGYPLPRIINGNIKYWKKQATKKSTATVIRNTMRDVEEFARFRFAKYSSCYIDILRFFFRSSGQEKYLSSIPDLAIWLEFGVSKQTQISLMGIGLSRQTAIAISELIADENMQRDDVVQWLKNQEFYDSSISMIMLAEIEKVRDAL